MIDRVIYCGQSMSHFGQILAGIHKAPLIAGGFVPVCEEVYIVGMYDFPLYLDTIEATKQAKRRIIHWCGSDVMNISRPDMLPPDAIHLCESEALKDELYEFGIDATVCMFPTPVRVPVKPLPAEPIISVYYGSNPKFYGDDMVRKVQEALPDVPWHPFMYGAYPQEQMPEVIERSTMLLRITPHDGSANTAREFMEGGRRVVCTADLPFAKKVRHDDFNQIVGAVAKCLKESEPDYEAASHYAAFNAPERYMAALGEIL